MQTVSARTPLIIAGVAAILTYHFVGNHGPVGFLKTVGLIHGDHGAKASITIDTDDAKDSDSDDGDEAGASTGDRKVAPFDKIEFVNNADATVQIGDTQMVSVTAPHGAHVRTDVHDGKLTISSRAAGAHIVVTVPHLRSVEANGPSKVVLVGLKDPIKIAAHGPSLISATGTVDSADLELDGPSKVSMKTLETKNLTVKLNGLGEAEVFATETLNASVNGVGRVRYLGDPHTVSTIHGLGSVEKLQS